MRPYQTLILVFIILAGCVYLYWRSHRPHPLTDEFVDCYIELSILHQRGDTNSSTYGVQKDSILKVFGFTEQSFKALKQEFDKDPLKTTDIWDEIDKKMRERKDAGVPKE
jgi:hypothetical protein